MKKIRKVQTRPKRTNPDTNGLALRIPPARAGEPSRVIAQAPARISPEIYRTAIRPAVLAGLTVLDWNELCVGDDALPAVVEELQRQSAAVSKGDLSRLEGMLTSQAHTLDAIFNRCARGAFKNMGKFPEAFERYMRMALRAQSQCRSSIEAIGELKNPKSFAVIAQANVAHGPQQVNNIAPQARASEDQDPKFRVLEAGNRERVDTSAACTPIESDSTMATVGALDRSKD